MSETPKPPVNTVEFIKMAYGDLQGFRELAGEFFEDVYRRQPSWQELAGQGNYDRLREELHRCKGGASIFGMERVISLIKAAEEVEALELHGFDFSTFIMELKDAERAIAVIDSGAEKA